MTLVTPAPARARIEQTALGLRILIPARRRLLLQLFLGAWLCGWGFGEATVPHALLSRTPTHAPVAFLAVWLVLWTLGGGYAIYTFLWMLRGQEIIELSADRLSIRRDVMGLGRTREYALADLRNLRVTPLAYTPGDPRMTMAVWGIGGGCIAFDYGAATVRCGAGIEEAEAAGVLKALRERNGALAARA